jgi:hypothetical protein
MTASQRIQALDSPTPAAGYDLLRRHPSAAGYDALKRYLRRAARYQLSHAGKDAVAVRLARLMLEEGQAAEAYDALAAMPERGGGGDAEFQRSALMGAVRVGQWEAGMRAAATASAARGRGRGRGGGGGAGGDGDGAWDGYSRSAAAWAGAGRAAQELCNGAEKHLRRAVELRPGATGAALDLVRLARAQGKRAGEGAAGGRGGACAHYGVGGPRRVCLWLTHPLAPRFVQMRCGRPGRSAGAPPATQTRTPRCCSCCAASSRCGRRR